MAARTLLHTGPGATAVAAATALRSAAAGHRTLLLSTGPTHGLGDVLATALGPGPSEVGPRLSALEVGARAELERRWPAASAWLATGPLPPGSPELAAGLVLAEHALADAWDVVVADCGATGEALRLLELPEVARGWVARVAPAHRRLAGALRPLAGAVAPPAEALLAEGGRLARVLLAFDDVLRDPERCSVRLVAEGLAPASGRRTAALLELHGLGLDLVVAEPGADAAAYAPVPVLAVEGLRALDRDGLDRLAAALWGGRDPLAVVHPHPAPDLVIGRRDATLRLELPHAARDELRLHRVGDALVVALGEHRQALALPAAVCDYRPAGARFADGVLQVELRRPDP